MKKIIPVVLLLVGAAAFYFYKQSQFDEKNAAHTRWMRTIPALAQQFDSGRAGAFLKNKTVAQVERTEFPRFSRDTLYVKFDPTFNYSYADGVLRMHPEKYADSSAALILIYAAAQHLIATEPYDYGEFAPVKLEMNRVRALDYVVDVLTGVMDTAFAAAVQREAEHVRHLTEYSEMDSLGQKKIARIYDTNLGSPRSHQDSYFRMYLFHVAGAFRMCELPHLDAVQSLRCKLYYFNEIFT